MSCKCKLLLDRIKIIESACTLIPTLIALVAITSFTDVTVFEGIKYFLFTIFAILIPGMCLTKVIEFGKISGIQELAFSYAFGYVMQIINWLLLAPCRALEFINIIIIVEDALLVVYTIKKTSMEQYEERDTCDYWACGLFLVVLLLLSVVVFTGYNLIPFGNKINTLNQINDMYFYAENTLAAKYTFPVQDVRWIGKNLYYHYLSNAHNAIICSSTGISVAKIDLELNCVHTTTMLVLSVYALYTQLELSKKAKIVAMIWTFFTAGYCHEACVYWLGHVFVQPFGYNVGVALSVVSLSLVFIQDKSEKTNYKMLICLAVVFAAATGSKGPVAMVYLAGIGFIEIIWLLRKKYVKGMLYGLTTLLSFLTTYYFVLADRGGKLDDGVLRKSLFQGFLYPLHTYPVGATYDLLIDKGIPVIFAKIALVVVWLYNASPLFFLTGILALTIVLIRKRYTDYRISMGFMIAIAILLVCLIKESGASEMYFIMAVFPVASGMIADVFDEYSKERREYLSANPIRKRFFYIIVAALTIWGMILGYESISEYIYGGMNNINQKGKFTNNENEYSPRLLKNKEIEAYTWIRENTTWDDIVVNNAYMLDEYKGYFIPSVFMERRQWIDGFVYTSEHHVDVSNTMIDEKRELLSNLYSGDENALLKIKEENVDYVVELKEIHMNGKKSSIDDLNIYLDKVFDNVEVCVYKIK